MRPPVDPNDPEPGAGQAAEDPSPGPVASGPRPSEPREAPGRERSRADDLDGTLRRLAEPGGVLDGLLGRLAADWRRFRWNPDPSRLPPLEMDVEAFRAQLASVRALLGGPSPRDETTDRGRREANLTSADRLVALEDELRRLLHRAASLERDSARPSPEAAVGGTTSGAKASWSRPAPDAASESDPTVTASAEDEETHRRVLAVDRLLEIIARSWERARAQPRPEQIGLLRSRLRDMLMELAALRAFLEGRESGPASHGSPWEGEAGAERGPPRLGEEAPEEGPRASDEVDGGAGASEADPRESGQDVSPSNHIPYRDAVTGSFTREGFDVLVRGEIRRCRRHERALSLLLVEFQSDGPRLGDAAGALRGELRGYDLVARHAERRVAVALPETTAEDARIVARRILGILAATSEGVVPFRMGLSTYPLDGETLTALSEAARLRLITPALDSGGPRETTRTP